MSATATQRLVAGRAPRRRAASASSGGHGAARRARRSRSPTRPSAAMPPSAQGPQATEVAGRPRRGGARRARRGRRWRRRSWPGRRLPKMPATEENSTNASGRGPRVSSCRCRARVGLGAQHVVAAARGRARRATPSSSTPAAWTTAVERVLGGTAGEQRGERVAVGDVAGGDGDPGAERGSSSASSAAPGASGPRRLVSSRCSAPCAASQRATWAPRAPVPPVTRTVPRGVQPGAGRSPRAGRGRAGGRRAGGADGDLVLAAGSGQDVARSRSAARSSSVVGQVDQAAPAVGCSRAATRPRPQTRRLGGAG